MEDQDKTGKEQHTQRLPAWMKMKSRLPKDGNYHQVREVVENHQVHTICTSGNCPNIGECWGNGTATFMILGDICTRSCKFCGVKTGKPEPIDENEPDRVARSIKIMRIKHAVLTSVDRDDLPDKGASHWARTIQVCKEHNPGLTMETLIPDFDAQPHLIQLVTHAGPDVVSHNLETVARLTPAIRSRARYDRSLEVIRQIAQSESIAKSGLMLGIGETFEEVEIAMDDLRSAGCQVLTLGQYLQPSRNHLKVEKWITPEDFDYLQSLALAKGFRHVESSPLVRSSYHAEKHIQ